MRRAIFEASILAGCVGAVAVAGGLAACTAETGDAERVPAVRPLVAITDAGTPEDASAPEDANAPPDTGPPPTCADYPGTVPANDSDAGDAGASATTTTTVYAVSQLFLGDTDPGTTTSATSAWTFFGLNIDGIDREPGSTNVCTPAAGAAASRLVNGCNGIDNSWGENVLPLLSQFLVNPSQNENLQLAMGQPTMLLAVHGLPSTLGDSAGLTAELYASGPLGHAPKLDGSDVWPIDEATTAGSGSSAALLTFPAAYVTAGTFVSGPSQGTSSVTLWVEGTKFAIPITHAELTMRLSDDEKSATAGNLSAVVPTQPFLSSVQIIAGNISSSLCAGSAFQSVATAVEQAQDILADGTNAAGQPCGAISIGIGFDATAAQLGGPATVPVFNECADGGASEPGDGGNAATPDAGTGPTTPSDGGSAGVTPVSPDAGGGDAGGAPPTHEEGSSDSSSGGCAVQGAPASAPSRLALFALGAIGFAFGARRRARRTA